MKFVSRCSIIACILMGLLAAGAAWAQGQDQQDDEDAVAAVNFVVLKDYNGKPLRNAAVVMHPVDRRGRQGKGGLELKTDADGKASYDGIPYGKLRVQALAEGFQTFGEDYDISKPTVAITIRLKRPQQQYSVYEEQPGTKKDDSSQEKPQNKDSGGKTQ